MTIKINRHSKFLKKNGKAYIATIYGSMLRILIDQLLIFIPNQTKLSENTTHIWLTVIPCIFYF